MKDYPPNAKIRCDADSTAGASVPASDGSAIPRALFSCSNKYCREEVSYYADQLYWYDQEKRWVCDNCWDNLPDPTDEDGRPTRGVTLAEHIIGGDFKAIALVRNAAMIDAERKP
jgi:hypothetical protein